jgi:hypothetical protein
MKQKNRHHDGGGLLLQGQFGGKNQYMVARSLRSSGKASSSGISQTFPIF